MPLWVVLYLLALAGVSAAGAWHNTRQRRPRWYILLGAGNEAALLAVGLAYWFAPAASMMTQIAFPLFIFGVAWLPVELKTELTAKTLHDPDLSPTGNVVAAISAIAFGIGLFAPLYYWGFLFAVQGRQALPPA